MALIFRKIVTEPTISTFQILLSQHVNAHSSTNLKEVLMDKIPEERERRMKFRAKSSSNKVVSNISVDPIYNEMQDMCGLAHEMTMMDPEHGIRFRGLDLPECRKQLPTAPNCIEPLPESLFWLLITGDVPTKEQVGALSADWRNRSEVPFFIINLIKKSTPDTPPISLLCSAINCLESKFVKSYSQGIFKVKYWEYVFEDSMDLLAKMPTIAALIYHQKNKTLSQIRPIDPKLDWAANLAQMMKLNDQNLYELMRLYLVIHIEHNGGSVAKPTAHLGSALSDPYKAFSEGLNSLADPLQGNTSQNVLEWLHSLRENLGNDLSEDTIKAFILDSLQRHKPIPGFGTGIFNKCDTRYLCLREFGLKHMSNSPMFQLVSSLYKIVPPILKEHENVEKPWPTVDAHSGIMLQHYGLKNPEFHTVILGVARALGTLASLVWDRALGIQIDRPKSASTDLLVKHLTVPKPKQIFTY